MLYQNRSSILTSTFLNCAVTANIVGNYTVTVLAQSTVLSHSITFSVQVPAPDFTIVASPAAQTLPQGKSATITLVFTRVLGLNDTIDFQLSAVNGTTTASYFDPSAVAFSATTVVLNPSSTNATVKLTVTANQTMPLGPLTLSIRSNGRVSSLVRIATAVVVVASTTSSVALQVNSVIPSTNSAMVGSTVNVAINVQNVGKVTETSTVVLLVGDQTVAQQNVTLTPGQNQTITLQWHTGQFSPGSYVIGGEILGVQGQSNLGSNLVRYSTSLSLTSSSTSFWDSAYFWPITIIGIIVVLAAVLAMFLQSRRKIQPSA
jgi:hypothetical protein